MELCKVVKRLISTGSKNNDSLLPTPSLTTYGRDRTYHIYPVEDMSHGGGERKKHLSSKKQKRSWGFPWLLQWFNTPPCNEGDMGSIPGQGTKIPQATEQLSPCTTTTESPCAAK